MIDLPNNVLEQLLSSKLRRGGVLVTEIRFGSEPPLYKRLILLNKNFSTNEIFYVLSTSQVVWYQKHCNAEPLKGNFIFVKQGQTRLNPDKPMVIDCRGVDSIRKEKLIENLRNRKLRFLSDIPNDLLMEIDKIVSASKLIPRKIKDLII